MDIKSVIKKYGVSQEEIAQKMGCSKGYISQLVNLKAEPSLSKLQELADIVGCKRWEFFKDEMEGANGIADANISGGRITNAPEHQNELPFDSKPTAPGMFICPHCGKGVVFKAVGE